MSKRFNSARDVLFFGLILPIILCCVALTVVFYLKHIFIPFILVLLIDILALWISVGTYYELTQDSLVIVSGPFRWKISYPDIKDVVVTQDSSSGPALSRNRLAVLSSNGKRVLISPQDINEFLSELSRKTAIKH